MLNQLEYCNLMHNWVCILFKEEPKWGLSTGTNYALLLHCRINIYKEFFIKGIVHQFWIRNIFFALIKEFFFHKRLITKKQLCLEIIEKIGCSKSVRVIYMIYITVLGWTDFKHPIFSIISRQSSFIEIDLS